MNDFDWGTTIGRFFISWIINDDFLGLAIRIGKEYADDVCCDVYHFTIQIGYGQLTIGIIGREGDEQEMKITRAQGEGQGQCALCKKRGKWNVKWMSFLYKVEGKDGVYCSDCVEEIRMQNAVDTRKR